MLQLCDLIVRYVNFNRLIDRLNSEIKGWTLKLDVWIPHWLIYLEFLNSLNSINFENQIEFNSSLKMINLKVIITSH